MTPTHHALSEQQPRRSSRLGGLQSSSRSDEDLLELVAERRDDAAFDEFYGRYGRAVYAVVVRMVGDCAVSEDVVQHAFTNVWRAAPGYRRERGPATGWLFAIARDVRRRRAASAAAEEAFRVHAAVGRRGRACHAADRVPPSGSRPRA